MGIANVLCQMGLRARAVRVASSCSDECMREASLEHALVRSRWWPILVLALFCLVVTSGAHAAPPTPQFHPGFPVVAGPNVMVMWTPVPGAVSYRLYMNGEKVAEAPMAPVQIATPTAGGSYAFTLTALDAGGAESPASAPSAIEIIVLQPPSELVVRASEDQVILRWKAAAGAAFYNVYRSTTSGDGYELLDSTQSQTYSDAQLEAGQTYYYVVTAKSVMGAESERSGEASAQMLVKEAVAEEDFLEMVVQPSTLLTEVFDVDKPFDAVLLGGAEMAVAAAGTRQPGVYFIELEGGVEFVFTPEDTEEGVRHEFTGVCLASDGSVLAVDRKTAQIYRLDNTGALVGVWSPLAEIPEDLKPHLPKDPFVLFDIVQLPSGEFAVSEQRNSKLLVLNEDMELVRVFSQFGRAPGQVISPTHLAVNSKGQVLVVDGGNQQVDVFDPTDGSHVLAFGKAGNTVGRFLRMSGLTVDSADNIYVGDVAQNNIQQFGPDGAFLSVVVNEAGDGNIASSPTGIHLRGKRLAVATALLDRAQFFQLSGELINKGKGKQ